MQSGSLSRLSVNILSRLWQKHASLSNSYIHILPTPTSHSFVHELCLTLHDPSEHSFPGLVTLLAFLSQSSSLDHLEACRLYTSSDPFLFITTLRYTYRDPTIFFDICPRDTGALAYSQWSHSLYYSLCRVKTASRAQGPFMLICCNQKILIGMCRAFLSYTQAW